MLPGLTSRRRSTDRTKGMWVCPHTIVATSGGRSAKTSTHLARRVSTRRTSSSSRGVPWQEVTGPKPWTSTVTGCGSAASSST